VGLKEDRESAYGVYSGGLGPARGLDAPWRASRIVPRARIAVK